MALGALALYIYTAYPEPGWIDSGVLAFVSHTLDIPHPTGKQLYVILSRLFAAVWPGSFFPLTLLSSLCVSAGVWTIARFPYPGGPASAALGGIAAAIALGVAPLVWEQGTINEVHGLQILLFAGFLHFWFHGPSPRRLIMMCYLASLAFGNHGTGIFLAPFLMAGLWQARRRLRLFWTAVAAGVFGLSLFAYFPIRSAGGALLDWGGTSRWTGFWHHVSGWQYSIWFGADDLAGLGRSAAAFFGTLWDNLPWLIPPAALFGLYSLWRTKRRAFWASAIAFLFCAYFSCNYTIPDIAAYYLLAVIVVAVWAGIGVAQVHTRNRWAGYTAAAAVILPLVAAFPGRLRALDRHEFHVACDWVRDALETVAPGSLVLTREWDHYSPWLYLRFVRGFRPDVNWIDTELLRRSWYPEFVRKVDPERYRLAKPALDGLAPEIARFEAGLSYDPARIEGAYADAIYALSLAQPGSVYVDGVAGQPEAWGVERVYLRGAHEVPWGLFTLAVRPSEPVPPLPPWPDYRNASADARGDPRAQFHLGLYERARSARAAFGR